MSRLYQYAESNDDSGLFLIDGYEGQNTTFQTTPLAERLFEQLDYEPGIKGRTRGPRIPDALHWGLFEIGWLETGKSEEPTAAGEVGVVLREGEGVDMTDALAEEIAAFLTEVDDADGDADELLDILGFDASGARADEGAGASQTHVTALSDSRCETFATAVGDRVRSALGTAADSEWQLTYLVGERLDEDTIQIVVKLVQESGRQYFHKVQFTDSEELAYFLTAVDRPLEWQDRRHVGRHRAEILAAVVTVSDSEGIDLGGPMAPVTFDLEHEPSIVQFGGGLV